MRGLVSFFQNPWTRGLLVLALLGLALFGIWWQGPEWSDVYHAFDFVRWWWIVAGFALNLLSVLSRAISWHVTIRQALPEPHPRFSHVFSAFGVGLLGNAILPARAGELARVAVLRRHLPHGPGTSATLLGTVFAHRLFDVVPVVLLVAYVFSTAKIPHWAVTSLVVVVLVGGALFTVAVVSARRGGSTLHDAPLPAAMAIFFQTVGWTLQLLAVWVVTEAFEMDVPLSAAALVLLLMNVATIFPLWPGNVGLLQAAVALPLRQYGVAYGTGFAYGLVLQAIEMSVGVGVGLVMLAREGMSFATLRRMEEEQDSDENALPDGDGQTVEAERESAGVASV